MDRCGLADRICAGSGWVGIRPGAVEASPGKCYPRIAFRSNLRTENHPFSRQNPASTLARPRSMLYQSSFSPN
jgi:hypothetical protein